MAVVVETTIGDFTVDLFTEQRPRACENFLKLCKLKRYNFSLFHKVQRDFVAQTGDPDANGRGGFSVYGFMYGEEARFFHGEKLPKLRHLSTGTVSFASHGDNLFGSQFFITLADKLDSLDGEHCVFGQITEGCQQLVAKFNEIVCDAAGRPYQDVRISHTVVLHDPFDDPPLLRPPSRSPEVTRSAVESDRICVDEAPDDTAGMSAEELQELLEQRETQARATVLEMIGDLPDADSAPPENVLFVCKLNPVTNDDDLRVIFSRFGRIINCEIIRDRRTGASLQYGFVEFDNARSCEDAYFKMDNVLIDDRRIHVDFSQSVARVRYHGRGRVSYERGMDAAAVGRQHAAAGRSGPSGYRGRGRTRQPDNHSEAGRSRGSAMPSSQANERRRGREEQERSGRGNDSAVDKLAEMGVDKLKALLNDSDSSSASDTDSDRSKKKRKKKKTKKKHKKHHSKRRSPSPRSRTTKKHVKSKKSKRRRRNSSSSSCSESSS